MKIYNTAIPFNYQIRPSWLVVQSKFSLFVPEFQFRSDWKQPSPRLEKWCKTRNCCVHRMGYNDKRKLNFKCFTVDDWFITNRDFLGSGVNDTSLFILDSFLSSLLSGSRIILNEPSVLFDNKSSFNSFEKWVLYLVRKHPHLKFQVAVQVHLQWIDSFWISNNLVFWRCWIKV